MVSDGVQVAQAPAPAAQPQTTAPAAQQRADALLLYKQGRDLEIAGKRTEAIARYREAVTVCDRELAADATRMDSYTVKCWSLFRLGSYRDVVSVGTAGLKVKYDARIVEVMGEAYYYLGDDANTIKYLQKYIETSGEWADRVSTAYFFMAESYMRQKKFDHADIAYSMATHRDPGIARWWMRYASAVEALGEYARASELYSKALKLSPALEEAKQGLARVNARL